MWKRRARRAAIGLVAILLVVAAVGTLLWRDRPSLDSTGWASPPLPEENSAAVTATWLGVTTLLFDDGETQILIDGFISRPTLLESVLRRPVANDAATINYALHEFDIRRLAAIIPVHSHFDHAMDTGAIAKRTSALVLGSESTANIARGAGVPDDQIIVATDGQQLRIRRVQGTPAALRACADRLGWQRASSRHNRRARQYAATHRCLPGGHKLFDRDRTCPGTTLVQGSAGYIEGALETVAADVVMLSVGALTTLDADYAEKYWQETVTSTGAATVYPIHFDDFTKPFGSVVPSPRFLGNLEKTAQWLDEFRATWDRETRIYLPRFGEPIALYAQPASTT